MKTIRFTLLMSAFVLILFSCEKEKDDPKQPRVNKDPIEKLNEQISINDIVYDLISCNTYSIPTGHTEFIFQINDTTNGMFDVSYDLMTGNKIDIPTLSDTSYYSFHFGQGTSFLSMGSENQETGWLKVVLDNSVTPNVFRVTFSISNEESKVLANFSAQPSDLLSK